MIEFNAHAPVVPDELYSLMDDEFMAVHERWQNAAFEDVVTPPEVYPVHISDFEQVLLAHQKPVEDPDGSVVALAFPFQQDLNKTMLMRAAFMQQAVTPHSDVLLLSNNHFGLDKSFSLSKEDKRRMAEGSLAPVAEKYARAIEKILKVGSLSLTGYSQGARLAVEMAALSPDFNITHINADEAPSAAGRDAKQLQKDFLGSGTLSAQRKSMAEAGFGSLLERTARNLPLDYAVFGINSIRAASRAMHKGMTGSMSGSLNAALANYPEMWVKIGVVEGSSLTDMSDLMLADPNESYRFSTVRYTGEGANAHTTGDNYAAHALMVKHGITV